MGTLPSTKMMNEREKKFECGRRGKWREVRGGRREGGKKINKEVPMFVCTKK